MRLMCFDIGGTNVKYGVIENGKFLEKGLFDTNADKGKAHLTKILVDMVKERKEKYCLEGVGISCAGCVDYANACTSAAPDALPDFSNWNFREIFKNEVGLDCIADNDVNSFAKAECLDGVAKEFNHFIVLTVGTGIGGAIVVNDEVWRGKNYNAGEVGRMLIGNARWETVASMSALIKDARRAGLDVKNGVELFELYDKMNPLAIAVICRFYDLLAAGIANIIYFFNPEAIVIGGGISRRPNFTGELEKFVNAHLPASFQNTAKLVPASFQNDGGCLGAYYNFVEYKKNKGE